MVAEHESVRYSTYLLVVYLIRGILAGIIRMLIMFFWIILQESATLLYCLDCSSSITRAHAVAWLLCSPFPQ